MSGGQVQEEDKGAGGYGTFQGPPSYPPPRPPPLGFPQPVPPPAHHRAAAPGVRGHGHDRLPCCGIGFGWFLFILGFFLGAIPWYVGAILLCCSRVDHRGKPAYVACTVAAILATIAVTIGATAGAHFY
ncbi:60S ribosomal protein L18a-like protein [Panicum virgatum]|uniref:60S ribosomal protein L18a-like protein n=1 Tax=Panicum virgatum TaxID=38727 RepID=A0A8T0SBU2_PANVG|nr:60S ribosomal protein L18a-like protein [Panicum virgatum]KAG2594558.1 hypothetical protein PVAP13_5KG000500 [Panicum virgatum]